MKHISQPHPSGICGQIAVAVLTGKSVAEVCQLVGHKHGTRTKSLRDALLVLGYDCPMRRPVVRTFPPEDSFGILHIREDGKKWGGHWVAVAEGKVWDGNIDAEVSLHNYSLFVKDAHWHITSFLPVSKRGGTTMREVDISKLNREQLEDELAVAQDQSSGTRYLGCSGNVPVFSDDFAAGGKPKSDDQEQPTRSDDGKEEESAPARRRP